jgi:AcrR family transcriptional regulator
MPLRMNTPLPKPGIAAAKAAPRPRVGRPPSLNTQAIVGAALTIGLDKVSFKQLAARLGVNVATIYRYVRNRNELLRLAAFQLTLRYAEEMFETFMKEPELLSELLKGSVGPHVEMDVLDQFLGAMSRYGFTPEEGLLLHQAIGTMTMGAATGVIAVKARQAAGIPWHVEIRRTLIERADGDLPYVRRAMSEYLNFDEWHWLVPLHHLLAGIAAERGEELPAPQGRLARFFIAAPKPHERPVERPNLHHVAPEATASTGPS